MAKKYIRCDPEDKRIRDTMAAQLPQNKEQTFKEMMRYVAENKQDFVREARRNADRSTRRSNAGRKPKFFSGGFGFDA
jgi:hypothetical protein